VNADRSAIAAPLVLDKAEALTVAELLEEPGTHSGRRRGWVVRRALAAADIAGITLAFVLAEALIGAGVSIVAELGQRVLTDERTTDARDVVANTLGSALGALATVLVLRALSAGSSARRSGSRPAPPSPGRARSRRPRAPARGA